MGQKYSINSAGRIVAERDIYSLGGFIPKGSVGAKIADETQLSQSGECWVAGGDISARPDVVIKDNAYIGVWNPTSAALHTDVIAEFSGNTLIPGTFISRCFAADLKNNFFCKDSFIGVSMDVLCGPESTTTAFPFGQGVYNNDAAKGTLFENMVVTPIPVNICRSFADLRLGKDTYLYIPTGYNCRILWAYYDTSDRLAYSGESTAFAAGLHKLSHPVYKVARINIAKANGTAMTPTDLLAIGAKILGHISRSVTIDIRPESTSGSYVMDNSSFIMNTDNFGLDATQLRFLAGRMYNTNMYTKTDRQDYKPYGTFHNVERLEYTKYLGDSHRTAATRDTYTSAYDCPLLRVDDTTYDDPLAAKGNHVLRRCVVPKAAFAVDKVDGNTYEDIDFSYANEDLGYTMTGYARFISSHKQGIYRMSGGPSSTGFASHKGNLADTARLYQAEEYIPLDGSIMEQGSYVGTFGAYYEDSKNTAADRVRTRKPLPTVGAVFPTLPAGFKVTFIVYLREDFKIQSAQVNPTTIETVYPYFVMVFGKSDSSLVTPSDFIALNLSLTFSEYTKTPEITGSAYVGAGCTVRGDVQLHGDPYVNRIFDVNEWDRGGLNTAPGLTWDVMKDGRNSDIRMTTKSIYPVNPGDTISVSGAYRILLCWFNSDQKLMSDTGWNDGTLTVPANVHYVGIALSTKPDLKFLDFPDIPLANVKYLRAFKKRRYITNELDRKSPEDILLGLDLWMKNSVSTSPADKGRYFKELIGVSNKYLIPKSPINSGSAWSITTGVPGTYACSSGSWDAITKFLGGGTAANAALMTVEIRALSGDDLALSDAFRARIVIEFTPTPRIIVPYGSATMFISGPKIRMYDNAVLSRNLNQEGGIVLQGDAVMGYDFNSGSCMCSNGHSDAIIKLP